MSIAQKLMDFVKADPYQEAEPYTPGSQFSTPPNTAGGSAPTAYNPADDIPEGQREYLKEGMVRNTGKAPSELGIREYTLSKGTKPFVDLRDLHKDAPETYASMHPIENEQLGAGGIIFNEKGEVLVVTPKGEDRYTHPKGRPNAGESEIETALREVEEETGLVPDSYEEILGYYNTSNQSNKYYAMHVKSDADLTKFLTDETTAVKWLSPEDAAQH